MISVKIPLTTFAILCLGQMPEGALLDNDVVLKMSSYRLGAELLAISTIGDIQPAILAVARYTLPNVVKKSRSLVDKAAAQVALDELLQKVRQLEPTAEEIDIAANFEEQAQLLSLELDAGESQLVAILLLRQAQLLMTGDKRAIKALEQISPDDARGRLCCLEQLIAALLLKMDHTALRAQICQEPKTDLAVTICFSCSATTTTALNTGDGLMSYISEIREDAPRLLIPNDELFAKIS